jgi:sirohydrochlorin ferrochelatase
MWRRGLGACIGGQVERSPERKRAVLLVGHGSESIEYSCGSIRLLANRLRLHPALGQVEPAFIHGKPSLTTILERFSGEWHICVVPMFAAEGHYTSTAIPAALKAARKAGSSCILEQAPALGLQPAYTASLASRARHLAVRAGIDPSRAAFLAIGHGSRRVSGPIDDAAGRLAAAMLPDFAASQALYLDCEPRAASWPMRVSATEIVVAPVFFSDARHAGEDVPRLFGAGGRFPTNRDEIAGPWSVEGRRVWYATMPPVTDDVVEIIASLACRGERHGGPGDGARAVKPRQQGSSAIGGAA